MKNKPLFAEFPPVSTKAWKQKIQVDLKGADYNETLLWETPEDIHVKPFYNQDDLDGVGYARTEPPEAWFIGQDISVKKAEQANNEAHELLTKGVQSLIFHVPDTTVDPKILLQDLELSKEPVYLELDTYSPSAISPFINLANEKKNPFFFGLDPLGNFARTGNWYMDEEQDFNILSGLLKSGGNCSLFKIDLALYQNAGANMVQQLAYGLGQAHEYLLRFREVFKPPAAGYPALAFHVAIGGNYFQEIAKLRALRILWASLAKEYGIDQNCHILARPSKRNKTLYDYNVNMLRTTAECMSAILGGANTVVNLPYDALYHEPNEFGDRIARNQLLILKEESYFDKVCNPSDGAYYIESLSLQLAQKALNLFKNMEAGGGWLAQLKKHTLQRKIKESAQKEQDAYDNGKLVLIGSNKYPNPQDRMKGQLEKSPFQKKVARKTQIEPILEKRLAEKEEQKRLKDE